MTIEIYVRFFLRKGKGCVMCWKVWDEGRCGLREDVCYVVEGVGWGKVWRSQKGLCNNYQLLRIHPSSSSSFSFIKNVSFESSFYTTSCFNHLTWHASHASLRIIRLGTGRLRILDYMIHWRWHSCFVPLCKLIPATLHGRRFTKKLL